MFVHPHLAQDFCPFILLHQRLKPCLVFVGLSSLCYRPFLFSQTNINFAQTFISFDLKMIQMCHIYCNKQTNARSDTSFRYIKNKMNYIYCLVPRAKMFRGINAAAYMSEKLIFSHCQQNNYHVTSLFTI